MGKRVVKYYKTTKLTYHGQVVDVEHKPNLVNPVRFVCFFEEDKDTDSFNYKELSKLIAAADSGAA